MIIGKGLLARAFTAKFGNTSDVLIYASGVSNSGETKAEEFCREKKQLIGELNEFDGRFFIYFSSCGVANDSAVLAPYYQHKLRMEKMVINHPAGIVFRLPQVVGKTCNPNTLTNFLNERIMRGGHFNVWARAERNLIDIDDVFAISSYLLDSGMSQQRIVNIASENSIRVIDIVKYFEKIHGKAANCTLLDKGDPLKIKADLAWQAAKQLGIDLSSGYAERIVQKYYAISQG